MHDINIAQHNISTASTLDTQKKRNSALSVIEMLNIAKDAPSSELT